MELEQTSIYPFIQDHPELCSVKAFEAGEIISHATVKEDICWFLVKGIVEVSATSYTGKFVHVDYIREDNFVGKISQGFGADFYCDCTAFTPCELLHIPRNVFIDLISKDIAFSHFFYQRIASNMYFLYKHVLATRIFSQKQLVAAFILSNAKDSVLFINRIDDICQATGTSNRHFYNLIENMVSEGIISYKKPKTIFIRKEDALTQVASPVIAYFNNNY